MLICVVLAGGRGTRLIPLTDTCPKPLLKVADKTLLEWNMEPVSPFVDKFVIVVSYLGQQIIDQIGTEFNGKPVEYVWQKNPKGGTLDAFRTAIFEGNLDANLARTENHNENQKADYLVIHADDIHGQETWQNIQNKIQKNSQKAYLSGKIIEPNLASSFGMFQVHEKISETEINRLQKELENQNKGIIVDCFLQNEKGEILVQKRSANRRLFPSCWDLPGGHVDAGDTILEAINKEILEETGIEDFEVINLTHKNDWTVPLESRKNDDNPNKIILQFLTKVKNTENITMEEGKVTEFRWISPHDNLEFLKENRTEDFYIYETVRNFFKNQSENNTQTGKMKFSEFEFVNIVEKPDYFVSTLANIAISYFPNKVLQFVPKEIINLPSGQKEAYITDLFNEYSQNFPIEVVPTNGLWLPVTSIDDLENANKIMQKL